MNRAKFFASVGSPLFAGKMSDAQVEGIDAILDECRTATDPAKASGRNPGRGAPRNWQQDVASFGKSQSLRKAADGSLAQSIPNARRGRSGRQLTR